MPTSPALIFAECLLFFIRLLNKKLVSHRAVADKSVSVPHWQHRALSGFKNIFYLVAGRATIVCVHVFPAVFALVVHMYFIQPLLRAEFCANKLHGHVHFAVVLRHFDMQQEVVDAQNDEVDLLTVAANVLQLHFCVHVGLTPIRMHVVEMAGYFTQFTWKIYWWKCINEAEGHWVNLSTHILCLIIRGLKCS